MQIPVTPSMDMILSPILRIILPFEVGVSNEYVWNGVSWLFTSRANKAVFMENPAVYVPQYGGHGALAMARGYASDSNPNVWAIYRNRLFLFYSYTARAAWAEAVDLHVGRADGEWPKIETTLSR